MDNGGPLDEEVWRYGFSQSGKIIHLVINGVEVRDIKIRDCCESLADVLEMSKELIGKTPETVERGDLVFYGRNGPASVALRRAYNWRKSGKFGNYDALLVLRCFRRMMENYGLLPMPETPEKHAELVIAETPTPIIEIAPTLAEEPLIEEQRDLEEDLYSILGLEEDSGRPKKKGSKKK